MEWKPMEVIQNIITSDQNTASNIKTNGTLKTQYAIVLLNQPIINEQVFIALWNGASLRIAVDGGGNQWNYIRQNKIPSISFPQIVCGDLDSVQPELLELFETVGNIEIVETPDQNETDFTKAIRVLNDRINKDDTVNQVSKVIAFCETSGRFDQIMANVETLFHALNILPEEIQLFLMSSSSMTWLLPAGSHKIFCSVKNEKSTSSNIPIRYCSLIPIGSSCVLTTSGLKWNLTNDTLAFGKLVSTSNEIDKRTSDNDHCVQINNSNPILWSMELEL